MWKSEAEYRSLFYRRSGEKSDITNDIEKEIDDLSQYIINITGKDTIDKSTMKACKEQIDELKAKMDKVGKREKKDYLFCFRTGVASICSVKL